MLRNPPLTIHKTVRAHAKRQKTTMRIKATLIFGLTFLLLSCGQQTDQKEKSSTESKTEADSATEKNEQVATTVPQNNGIVSPYQQELNKALADTSNSA